MKKHLTFVFLIVWGIASAQTTPSLSDAEMQYRAARAHEDLPTIASTATQAGALHLQAANFKRSTDYLLVAKDIYKNQNDSVNLAKVSCLLAENYYKTGNVKRYRDYIALAEQLIGKKTSLPEYVLLLDTQIGYYQSKNKTEQVQYLTNVKARLQQPAAATVAPAPAIIAQTEPEFSEPAVSETAVDMTSQIDLHQLAMILAIAIATISFIGLLYFSYKDRRRSLDQKKELERLQSQMLENLSRAISGINPNDNLHEISRQLADISRIKAGHKAPEFVLEPIGPFIQSVAAPLVERAGTRQVNVISNLERSGSKQMLDKETVRRILDLVGTEALAHTAPGDKMYLSATVEKGRLHIRISYPHPAVDKETLENLFNDLEHTQSPRQNPVAYALLGTLVDWYDGTIEATHDGQLLRIAIVLPLSEPVRHLKQVAASFL